jgi:hypothetical protein
LIGNKKYINYFKELSIIRFVETFNIEDQNFKTIYKKLIDEEHYKEIIANKSNYNMDNLEYGWAGSIIRGKKTKFEHILREVFKSEEYGKALNAFTVMYKLASEIIHSNNNEILIQKELIDAIVSSSLETYVIQSIGYIITKLLEGKSPNDITIFRKIFDLGVKKYDLIQ